MTMLGASKLSELAVDGKIYGVQVDDLSYRQAMKVIEFAMKVQPWLDDNIGAFGDEWMVEIDLEFDSLRLQFKDQQSEVYFKLAFMGRPEHRDGESE